MLVSLHTALGVLLHDTNLDKAFISGWKVAKVSAHVDSVDAKMPETTPHTHPEHIQLSDMLKTSSRNHRTTPRDNYRKHLHQKRVSRNTEFDGHRICIAPGLCF